MKKWVLFALMLTTKILAASVITEQNKQLLVVVAPEWESHSGYVARFERNESENWARVGEKIPVVIGKNGFAWGRGLHPESALYSLMKNEGDLKSPAGIFSIGHCFGTANDEFHNALLMDYLPLQAGVEAVDDPGSRFYNQIVSQESSVERDWASSERMWEIPLYALGFTVNNNFPKVIPGAGSAIFFHVWRDQDRPTAGCTAMRVEDLTAIVTWLDKEKQPLVVQLPLKAYLELAPSWELPELEPKAPSHHGSTISEIIDHYWRKYCISQGLDPDNMPPQPERDHDIVYECHQGADGLFSMSAKRYPIEKRDD